MITVMYSKEYRGFFKNLIARRVNNDGGATIYPETTADPKCAMQFDSEEHIDAIMAAVMMAFRLKDDPLKDFILMTMPGEAPEDQSCLPDSDPDAEPVQLPEPPPEVSVV